MRFVSFPAIARLFLVCLAIMLPLPVLAGGTATFSSGDSDTEIMWESKGAVLVKEAGVTEYLLMRDSKAYMVSFDEGEAQVLEMSGMLQAMGEMAKQQNELPLPDTVDSIKATGKNETVAGIKGEIHLITTTEDDGSTSTEEAVLTDNALVVEMTRAYLGAIESMLGAESVDTFTKVLPAKKSGILRVGNDFVLKSISGDQPAASKFELPAEPVNLGNLMQGLQEMMKQQQ